MARARGMPVVGEAHTNKTRVRSSGGLVCAVRERRMIESVCLSVSLHGMKEGQGIVDGTLGVS